MTVLRRLYTIYAGLMFLITFLLLFPVFLICIWVPHWEAYGRKVNQFWAKAYFTLIFLPIKIEGKEHIQKGQSYVFAANHFSYLDIAMSGFLPGDVVYIGKSSIRKIPLFGYYFSRLHIAVDRSSLKSRGEVLMRAKRQISKGSSIVLYPEGGITTPTPPIMSKFKDGAFNLAIDKQIPLIPVTLSYNHLILPDDGRLLLNFKSGKIVIHPPILTAGMNQKQVHEIKQKCFETIQGQLLKDNPDAIIP